MKTISQKTETVLTHGTINIYYSKSQWNYPQSDDCDIKDGYARYHFTPHSLYINDLDEVKQDLRPDKGLTKFVGLIHYYINLPKTY